MAGRPITCNLVVPGTQGHSEGVGSHTIQQNTIVIYSPPFVPSRSQRVTRHLAESTLNTLESPQVISARIRVIFKIRVFGLFCFACVELDVTNYCK
jgi:hypothetical protein